MKGYKRSGEALIMKGKQLIILAAVVAGSVSMGYFIGVLGTINSTPNSNPIDKLSQREIEILERLNALENGLDSLQGKSKITLPEKTTSSTGKQNTLLNNTDSSSNKINSGSIHNDTDKLSGNAQSLENVSLKPKVNIKVMQILYDPDGPDKENLNGEYVVFENIGDPLNMSNWVVSDAGGHKFTFPDIIFDTDDTLFVYSGSGTNAENKIFWGSRSPIWNNAGDTLYLKDPNGNIVLTYSYEPLSCTEGWLENYTCSSTKRQQLWQKDDCLTTWKDKEICSYGCENGACKPAPVTQNTSTENKTSNQEVQYNQTTNQTNQVLNETTNQTQSNASSSNFTNQTLNQTYNETSNQTQNQTQNQTINQTTSFSNFIYIAEIQYDPAGNDVYNLTEEWVRISNNGSTIDMSGWTLNDESNRTFSFPNGFILWANSNVTIRTGSGTNTASDLFWNSGSAIWNNDHDTAYLRNAIGELVANRSY